MNEQPTLRIERAVLREVHEDGMRRPYQIKAAAGMQPTQRGFGGMLTSLERRGLVVLRARNDWRLTAAGFECIREDA